MEREKKLGTHPLAHPPLKPITVDNINNSNGGVIVQSLPSPIVQMEDYGLRQLDTVKRLYTAAEQQDMKLGEEFVKEDLIGPHLR